MRDKRKGLLWANRLVLSGVALAVLYWLIEGTRDIFLYREEGGIVGRLLLPLSDLDELIWDRWDLTDPFLGTNYPTTDRLSRMGAEYLPVYTSMSPVLRRMGTGEA